MFFIVQKDLYERECGSDNPLRCFVGDVGNRLGPIGMLPLLLFIFI